jgi:hypothetical protein
VRTWGRNQDGVWEEVTTDANGFNDRIWLVTLCQCLLLNLNESPFWAAMGIPAEQSIIQQVQPDFYVSRMAQYFSQYFASLVVAKLPGAQNPTYRISVITSQGSKIIVDVPI